MAASFVLPDVQDNMEGWGPVGVPDQLKDVPFAPFSKSERLGRTADWTGQGYSKYNRYNRDRDVNPANAVFQFSMADEAEDSYQLVDNKPTQRKAFGQRRFQHQNRALQRRDDRDPMKDQQERKQRLQQQQQLKKNRQWQAQFQRGRWENRQQVQYSASVDVRPEWAVLEQIEFSALQKLSLTVAPPTDLRAVGVLQHYEKAYDRVTPKTGVKLQRSPRTFRNVTTAEDPIMKELAAAGEARVFATDRILTTLMCATRSVYSWDVCVTRKGDKLFFDKRDNAALELQTVNETAPEPPAEDRDSINGVQQLSAEATAINQHYSQQVLQQGGATVQLGDGPLPGAANSNLASGGYRYRKFDLSGAKDASSLPLVVRCEVDGVVRYKGEDQFVMLRAMNETDPRTTDWRHKLESQRGAVLAIELKNNSNKMARWTAQALLGGAEMMKLGYVTRSNPRDNTQHELLGTQMTKPKDFASQMNLKMEHGWGMVRALVDLCMKQPEGSYLILRDPNKQLLRLYEVSENAFVEDYSAEAVPELEEAPSLGPAAAAKQDDDV